MDQISSDDIEKYRNLFLNIIGEDDNAKQEAVAILDENARADLIKTILVSAAIASREDIPPHITHIALCYIKKLFTPTPGVSTEDMISQKWLQVDDPFRNQVRTAIFRCMMSDQSPVVSAASLTLVALLNIEKINMFSIIPELFTLIEDDKYSKLTKSGAINVLAEICGPDSLGGRADVSEVQELLVSIFNRCLTYFQKMGNKTIDVQFNIVRTLSALLDSKTPLFNEETVVNTLITNSIQYLEQSTTLLPNESSNSKPNQLHDQLLQVLYKLIKCNYKNQSFKIKQIQDYIFSYILKFNNPQMVPWVLCNFMQFWTLLADYEIQIINENRKLEKYSEVVKSKTQRKDLKQLKLPELSPFRNFCGQAIETLTDPLIQIMSMINPKEIGSEDIYSSDDREPHMYASCCLENFFKLRPNFLFDRVKAFCIFHLNQQIELNKSQQPLPPDHWIRDHTMLLTLNIILNKSNHLTDKIESFLYDPFSDESDGIIMHDFILTQCLKECQTPRVVDTCLYVLGNLVQHYPSLLTPTAFEILMEWIFSTINSITDPIIYYRVIVFLKFLLNMDNWNSLYPDIRKSIVTNYENFVGLFNASIEREDALTTKIFISSYMMIINVTVFVLLNNASGNEVFNLVNQQLEYLENLIRNPRDEMKTRVTHVLHLISSLFFLDQRYLDPIKPLYERIFDIFTQLFNPQSPVLEELLISCRIMCQKIPDNTDHILDKISGFIDIAFQSGNPSIITQAVYLRSCLYETFISNNLPDMGLFIDKFDENYRNVCDCLQSSQFTKEFYPDLLKSVAKMIRSCSDYKKDRFNEFYELYQHFAQMPLSLQTESDFEYANQYYDAMFCFLTVLIKSLDKIEMTRMQLTKLQKNLINSIPMRYVRDLFGKFSKNSLISALKYINQWIKTLEERGSIFLHRPCNFFIICWAFANEDVDQLFVEGTYQAFINT